MPRRRVRNQPPWASMYNVRQCMLDRLVYHIFLEKIACLGISCRTIAWCQSYLTHQTFTVSIGDLLYDLVTRSFKFSQDSLLSAFSVHALLTRPKCFQYLAIILHNLFDGAKMHHKFRKYLSAFPLGAWHICWSNNTSNNTLPRRVSAFDNAASRWLWEN